MDKLQSLLMVLTDISTPYHPDKISISLRKDGNLVIASVSKQPEGLCTALAVIDSGGVPKLTVSYEEDFFCGELPRILGLQYFQDSYCHDSDSVEDLLREGTEIFTKLTSPGFESGGEAKLAIQAWLAL